ncbi:MAG: tRNA pseudouridine(55) synthase TruB [bacterium]|nr:tRNA pseudouridine(55) synthase TruB [bacterium]MDY4100652.1 tRNA pseudouridine(55) synthase TruB [Lachnospiraceae bacterium]
MNGILNVYKEAGYTSFDVVAKLRGILREKKIGHTGTLDPAATGVLPVCVGNATKVCALLTDKDKEYEAVLQLGITTDTQDATGQILKDRSDLLHTLTKQRVEEVIMSFVGAYEQIPPMYSALKIGGRKLCDLAREGIEVERKARPVHIYGIEIRELSLPFVTMRVHCSKGTYIRTLCDDIGEQLGVGGLMKSLVRTRVSSFSLGEALTLAQIEEYRDNGRLDEILLPVDVVFQEYPALTVTAEARKLLQNGNRLLASDLTGALDISVFGSDARFRIYDGERFYAIYRWDAVRQDLKCIKMFM